jgi:hypothetical protein
MIPGRNLVLFIEYLSLSGEKWWKVEVIPL